MKTYRKLISKDDSANKAAKTDGVLDLSVANRCDRMKIQLGKILCDNGPYAPYGMCDFEYRISLPSAEKLKVAQDGEDIGTYKLTDVQIEFETIESTALAENVRSDYGTGRALGYDYITLVETEVWKKDSTRQSMAINIPRKSLKAVVMLFTKIDSKASEEFVYPNLKKVSISIEGNPNAVYSKGLEERDMYSEAVRFFGSSTCEKYIGSKCVSERKFYDDKFACVIDFRAIDDDTVSSSGRKLLGTQQGIKFEMVKEATTTDLTCRYFAIADGLVNMHGTKLNGQAIY